MMGEETGFPCDIACLHGGTPRQREAFTTLLGLRVFELLEAYRPTLVGTIPIQLYVNTSDLDIACEAYNLEGFERAVGEHFGNLRQFRIHRTRSLGLPASVCNFENGTFPIQIFGQPLSVRRQRAYRHMQVEGRLLALAGEDARRSIRALRERGMKTEPAVATYFRLPGDPYEALYALAEASDTELLALVQAING